MAGLYKFYAWIARVIIPKIVGNFEERRNQRWYETDIMRAPEFYASTLIRWEIKRRGIREGVFIKDLINRLMEMPPASRQRWHDRAKTIVDDWNKNSYQEDLSGFETR